MPGFSSVTGLPSYIYADNASFDGTQRGGGLVNNGQLWIGSASLPNVNTGFLNYQTAGATTIGSIINGPGTITVEDRSWLTRYVVDPTGTVGLRGTYQSISAAIAQAIADGGSNSNPKTIFIRPGTYTENPTLNAGVNLCAFESDSSTTGVANVTINGNCTFSQSGTVTLSGIMLKTNGAALLTISGSSASTVNLNNCFLDVTNSNAIIFSSSSSSANLNIDFSNGNVGATGITYFTSTSPGTITISYSNMGNSASSTTPSTASAGELILSHSEFSIPFSTTSTGGFAFTHSSIYLTSNATAVIHGGSGGAGGVSSAYLSRFNSGSATTITIASPAQTLLEHCIVNTTGTTAISGSGTLVYTGLVFFGGTSITVTTQSGGTLQGSTAQAPSAGYLGEQIRSYVSAQSIITATPTNVTSISITPGVWDVSAIFQTVDASFVITFAQMAITTGSATFAGTNLGDNSIQFSTNTSSIADLGLSIPSYRVVVTATTTYNMVGQMNAASGTLLVSSRISATRVA